MYVKLTISRKLKVAQKKSMHKKTFLEQFTSILKICPLVNEIFFVQNNLGEIFVNLIQTLISEVGDSIPKQPGHVGRASGGGVAGKTPHKYGGFRRKEIEHICLYIYKDIYFFINCFSTLFQYQTFHKILSSK